ncbi:hypothetical protein BDN72DRAFT_616394 [Pluteus cervinus]|uniref:Uncharacterized protein n=1 Tax=Pluteus cervinus TaxID=181527 RepID=A0ACD3AUC7_9AGAR|nr:hypothetical protein BDN72DRAFT_616394 [Pluteus cervinus]
MKSSLLAILLPLHLQLVQTLPTRRGMPGSDVETLNYALGIEQLETAFFQHGLAKYSKESFKYQGFDDWVYERFQQMAGHEKTHVKFLTKAIAAAGAVPVQPCLYNFPHSDPKSFIEMGVMIENVVTSAFNGILPFVANKSFLTAFGSILGVEARHAGWISSALLWVNPWNSAFETPLDANQAFSWLSGFIESCPHSTFHPSSPAFYAPPSHNNSSNSNPSFSNSYQHPYSDKPFPRFTLSPLARPGHTVHFDVDIPTEGLRGQQVFMHCIAGTGVYTSQVDVDKKTVYMPKGMKGVVYCLLSKEPKKVVDGTTIAGPAVVLCPFEADGKLH